MKKEKREKWEDQEGDGSLDFGRFGKIVKGTLVAVMFTLAGLLALRFWLHSYYPPDMREMLPTDVLVEAYAAEIPLTAKTQEIRVKYDDVNEGNFFADHLIVVDATGSLQITVRYNNSTLDKFAEKLEGFDPAAEDPFLYRIFACTGGEGKDLVGDIYTPEAYRNASLAMYQYRRLAFDGIDLEGVNWIRLEILREDTEEVVGTILIYENHEDYNLFEEYTVKELGN